MVVPEEFPDGLKFLPDLQKYRTEHNDYSRVVNAVSDAASSHDELREGAMESVEITSDPDALHAKMADQLARRDETQPRNSPCRSCNKVRSRSMSPGRSGWNGSRKPFSVPAVCIRRSTP